MALSKNVAKRKYFMSVMDMYITLISNSFLTNAFSPSFNKTHVHIPHSHIKLKSCFTIHSSLDEVAV